MSAGSQFIKPTQDIQHQPLEIRDPADKILLIYNHGSTPELQPDPCFPNNDFMPGGMPTVIHDLAGQNIAGREVVVYALCASHRGMVKKRDTPENLKLKARVKEILSEIEMFTRKGMNPSQIFLVGHSAGGWASLIIEANYPKKVNSVIAFSPAFAGIKRNRNAQWQRFRQEEAKSLQNAGKIDALVYAFQGDPYNSTQDLAFFGQIRGVDYYAFPDISIDRGKRCFRGHRGAFKRCFQQAESDRIKAFIRRRLREETLSH